MLIDVCQNSVNNFVEIIFKVFKGKKILIEWMSRRREDLLKESQHKDATERRGNDGRCKNIKTTKETKLKTEKIGKKE